MTVDLYAMLWTRDISSTSGVHTWAVDLPDSACNRSAVWTTLDGALLDRIADQVSQLLCCCRVDFWSVVQSAVHAADLAARLPTRRDDDSQGSGAAWTEKYR